ncbi:MAG: ABC transporter ATP-binding protein [Pseudomonadota bacterium]
MTTLISVNKLEKEYDNGFKALKSVDLQIEEGEIIALLGPNGAGKTTLISAICGIVNPTGGSVTVGGFDIINDFRKTRKLIGLVPQELTTDAFETVWATVSFTRGLFGLPRNDAHVEKILKDLSLWDKKDNKIIQLSGGMKRRVLIAKALSHEPRILFLDEPTAGVDVELRKDMWNVVRRLREDGVTIILTTHYIEEAEEIADRIAVIRAGEIIVVEEKNTLMKTLGKKTLTLELADPIKALPDSVSSFGAELAEDGQTLTYRYDANAERKGITRLLTALASDGIRFSDLSTSQSSLEDIFVDLVSSQGDAA